VAHLADTHIGIGNHACLLNWPEIEESPEKRVDLLFGALHAFLLLQRKKVLPLTTEGDSFPSRRKGRMDEDGKARKGCAVPTGTKAV
jgi:hypothetical protein